jgi:DNA (cytosine-5)-methyltransferase 1
MKPRLLDLFCGAGGAAVGYHRAGFEVVGVDIKPQPRYPFEFAQADALSVLEDGHYWQGLRPDGSTWHFYVQNFAAIHASPPCQAYSVATRDKSKHPDLIAEVRALLIATGLPYVIENVPGAPMENAVMLCGSSFNLRVRRHRLFETNWPLMTMPCAHGQQGQPVGVYGGGTGKGQKRGRKVMSSAEAMEVMEMPWSDRAGATQAIPPAYTEFIGTQLLAYLRAERLARQAVEAGVAR